MIRKNETQIMKNWAYSEPPLLTVVVITYNHENFIEEALDSILIQETDFPFEVLVHDDCSTDSTVNILVEYAKKYPTIVKLILQKENKYSQGIKPTGAPFEQALGKYIALCEGDDYWIDAKKLQIQIDLMKQYPDCDMSFHAAEERLNNNKHGKIISKHANGNKIFSTSEVLLGGGGFCPTASLVFHRKSLLMLPSFYEDAPVGDYLLQIFGSLNSGLLYIDKVMSVYRQGIPGSWTSLTGSVSKREEFTHSIIATFDKLDMYLNGKYQNEFKKIKSYYYADMSFYYLKNNMFAKFKEYIELSNNTNRLKSFQSIIYSLRFFPRLIKLFLRIKQANK